MIVENEVPRKNNVKELYLLSKDILRIFKNPEMEKEFSKLTETEERGLENNMRLYEAYMALYNNTKEKEEELRDVLNDWAELTNRSKNLAGMLRTALFVKNCHFTESFNLGAVSESPISGRIEQYNSNVVGFAPFEDPEFINAGLTLNAEFIPFFDSVKKRFFMETDPQKKQWTIRTADKIFIRIVLQGSAVEASWSDQLDVNDVKDANLLLFSVIRFNLGKTVVNDQGEQCKVFSPQYCQLLKPGKMKITNDSSRPVLVKIKKKSQPRYNRAVCTLENFSFLKDQTAEENWIKEQILYEGEFSLERFSGDANIEKGPEDASYPIIKLTANATDLVPDDFENGRGCVSIFDGEIELVLFRS